jgi:hypothetical protein
MARKTAKSKFPDRMHTLQIRCTGKQKNDIIAYSEKIDVSINQLVLYAVWDFMRNQKGISSPGPSQFSMSTFEDVLTAYARGERLLQPCGQPQCEQVLTNISGMEFCTVCNYRVG